MLPALSIVELQDLLRRREVSPAEVLESLQARINAVDDKIGAYLSLDLAAARPRQKKSDVNLPLGGIPIAHQGHHQRRRPAMHLRVENPARLSRTLHATVIEKLRAAGAIPFGKNEHGRIRDGILDGKFECAADAQSMGSCRACRADQAAVQPQLWLLTSLLARSAPTPADRFVSPRPVRSSRLQTQLWSGLALRSGRFCVLARSNRTANENCTRLRLADERDCRRTTRRIRLRSTQPVAGLHRESWSRSERNPHWACQRNT